MAVNDKAKQRVPQWLIDKRTSTIDDCHLFYSDNRLGSGNPPSSFGWDFGHGWNGVVSEMSYRIESLNLLIYPKFRVRCIAEQIKEKFGTLRTYYTIISDPPAWRQAPARFFWALHSKLDNIRTDFKLKRVIDMPRHKTCYCTKITKDTYENELKYKCSNTILHETSGRYYKYSIIDSAESVHFEPTRHRFLYWFKQRIRNIASSLTGWADNGMSRTQRIIYEYLESEVAKIVNDAETKCYNTCECCGSEIGSDWSPRCETTGWIRYVCEKCAAETGSVYIKDKKRYCKGELVK